MRALTHDTFELVVACDPASTPLQARAGQFAALRVAHVEKPRPYSFGRDPAAEQPGEHTFIIRLVPGGEMSAWLGAGDRTGEAVEIAGPLGGFGLDASQLPMVFIAGGSGMSAVKALAEAACRLQLARDCFFFYGARTASDLYCESDMETLRARWHPDHRFEFVQVLSDEPAGSAWNGPRGLVTDHFKTHCLDAGTVRVGGFRTFFCGPPPMIEAGRALLRSAGVDEAHIYCDVFEDARSPAPVIDNRKCVLCDECLLVKPVDRCIVETSALRVGADGRVSGCDPIAPAHTSGLYYNALVIDGDECIRCYACVQACPHGAISPAFESASHTLRRQ